MAFAKDKKTLNISTTLNNLQSMYNAQNFACSVLQDSSNGDFTTYLTNNLSGYSGTVLANVFGTQSASTIAKNIMRVRTDNRSLAYSVGSGGADYGVPRMNDVIRRAVSFGATSVSLSVDYVRVYDTNQSVTVFTVVDNVRTLSMTLPDGTVIQ